MKEERLHFLETVIQAQTEYFIAAAIKVRFPGIPVLL